MTISRRGVACERHSKNFSLATDEVFSVYQCVPHQCPQEGPNGVSLVTNIGTSAYERVVVFETVLKRQGITITRKILFEDSATSNDILNGSQMEEIKQSSRIVIVLFSSTRDLNAIFREASSKHGLSESEFVFIFPWLQEEVYGASPIAGNDNSILEKVKETYSNCVLVLYSSYYDMFCYTEVQIEDTNAFDDRTVTTFLERLDSIGLSERDIDMSNIYGYTALFESVKAFAIAGRHVLNSTGQISSVKNGKKIWNAMRRLTFPGMISNDSSGSGTVMLDDLAERIPFYSAFFVDKNKNQLNTPLHSAEEWKIISTSVPKLVAVISERLKKCVQ
ncbi:hypothetical protein ANCDUO_15360 [Ancylostoma duodenale]|uniref:Receptor ligand binding region domain-containing protein n=1 Tax=Ancylostoma duodenale TaxID=51022 RepID=A0A0C2CDT8_9BILA|nr:hypothetical protein ANCDUO_15360 [Ancylostoma duodenale]